MYISQVVVFSMLCFSYAQLLKYACVKLVVILEPSYFLPMSCILDNHHSFLSVVCFLYQGNISGQNEYVVYNAYRVVPEYVMEYSLQRDGRSVCLHRALSQYRARAASRAQRCNTVFPTRTLQTPSLPSFNFAVRPTVTSTPTTATNCDYQLSMMEPVTCVQKTQVLVSAGSPHGNSANTAGISLTVVLVRFHNIQQ